MKLKRISKYIATPVGIFTTLLIFLFALVFLQFFVNEIVIVSLYKTRTEQFSGPDDPNSKMHRSAKNFLPDGTIHLVYEPDEYRYADKVYRKEQIFDANHNLLWEGLRKDRPYEYLSWPGWSRGFTAHSMKEIRMITPEFSQTLEIPVNLQQGKVEQIWRYAPDMDIFVGYRFKAGIIGYAGSTGFTKSKDKARPFGRFENFYAWCPKDSFSPTLLWQTNHCIYQINFEKQRVDLLSQDHKDPIGRIRTHMWGHFSSDTEQFHISKKYRPIIHYSTKDGKHHLIMREPQQKLSITVPEDWKGDSVKLTATQKNIFLRHQGIDTKFSDTSPIFSKQWMDSRRDYLSKPHKRWVELYKVDNQGNLELLNRFDWISPARPVSSTLDPRLQIKGYATGASPLAYDLAWSLFGDKLYRFAHSGHGISREYAGIIERYRPGNSIFNWILTVGMVGFAFWHGLSRRTCWGKFIFWLVLVGLFNLAGLLTFLALYHTTDIKCSAGSKHPGLDKLDCVRCGAELPLPQRRELDLLFKT